MNKSVAFLLGVSIILVLIFRNLLILGPAVWGDAPFFYTEGLKELFREPQIWVNRNHNFGGVELSLWLAPLMFLYGSLHKFFSLNNDVIIRLLFYFPALVFSAISPIFFARHLKLPPIVQFFASLLFFANTYFLLLIDGGQVGVALAYSIFPLTLTFLLKLFDKPTLNNFYLALLFYFALQVADARIALISILAGILWVFATTVLNKSLQELRNLWILGPFGLALAGISSYWLIPLLTVSSGVTDILSSNSQSTLLDSFALFQPHWPFNQFGKVSSPPPYFAVIPILIIGSLFLRKTDKKYWPALVSFSIFAFLAKGNTKPFGEIYEWAATNLPYGVSFRDSTKFFIPLILFAGILLGLSMDRISSWTKNKLYKAVVILGVAVFLLLTIKPAWSGELNGVLSGRQKNSGIDTVYQKLTKEEGLFRTVYFPEKSPFSFQTEEKPAIDAKLLIQNRPFASLNTGNDAYNFFNSEVWPDYFNLLGIKYLVLSGDSRVVNKSEDKKELERVQNFIDVSRGVKKIDWSTPFSVYAVDEVKPRIFATNKLLIVSGADDIYQKIRTDNGNYTGFVNNKSFQTEKSPDFFSVGNQVFLFLDDGNANPEFLENVASKSATLVINNADENDFHLSYLQKYFTSLKNIKSTNWATRESRDYLSWKYELLQKGVKIQEFDYGKGIQFSTVQSEKTSIAVNAPKDGQYMLAVRSMSGKERNPLQLTFNGETVNVLYNKSDRFEWYLKGPVNLRKGNFDLELQNITGTHVFNTAALIPLGEWSRTFDEANEIKAKFETVVIDGSEKPGELPILVADSKWVPINYKMSSPTSYQVSSNPDYPWIVFTDNFSGFWKLNFKDESISSLPFYSMVNGFYVPKQSDTLEIVFKGQKQVRWGIYYSTLAVLGLMIIYFGIKSKKS